ncbi:MAG: tyrosine-type recombinase/integrase [Chitinophagales bacterium]|nr:tyrosine-type recombinase/integrase [Chitinophagales bacterium]
MNHQLFFREQFSRFIAASRSGRRLSASGKRIKKGTIINYEHALRLIIKFEEKTSRLLHIQLLHRASMRSLQKEKNYWQRFYRQFADFLYKDKKHNDNYVANTFKVIKTFMNYLQKEKGWVIGNYHKAFRVPIQQSAPVVLTPAQLGFLITNKEFEKGLNQYQKRAKDVFVFGCTVGLRYSDLMSLKKTNMIYSPEGHLLTLHTQKTGTEIKVPLPDYLMEIIKKYHIKAGRYLLPRLSCTNLNRQVKNLGRAAGWCYTLPKNISHRGNILEIKTKKGKSWPFYRHITAHTMRRTAITTLLLMGVPENMVRTVSGHAPGSKEFYKYIGIAQDYLNHEVKKAYQKLLESPALLPKQIRA